MTNNQYWQHRMETAQKLTEKQVTKKMKKLYQQANKRINKEIVSIWMQMLEDGEISQANLYKGNRFANLQTIIQSETVSLSRQNERYLTNSLMEIVKQGYSDVDSFIGIKTDLTMLNTLNAKKIVAQSYKNAIYSERIWQNTNKLRGIAEQKIIDSTVLGKDVRKVSRDLQRLMGVGYNQSKRLCVTETSRVFNESCRQRAMDRGYNSYQFLAYEDERTCEECMELDGKIFPLDDTAHMPPLHPNSRSSITIVLPD